MPRSCLLVARDESRIWTLNWLTSQPEIGSGILGVPPSPSMSFKRLGEGFVVEFHCPKPSNVWYIYLTFTIQINQMYIGKYANPMDFYG